MLTGPIPDHLPGRLAICLWDFSWYTRAGAGEPYQDLAAAIAGTRAMGHTTVRICAAPMLLFGDVGLDALASDLEIEGMGARDGGGYYGDGTRWYDTRGGYRLDLRERFFTLLTELDRAGMTVILSSWEYQQSSAFAASPAWWQGLDAIPASDRFAALARAAEVMLTEITAAGLAHVVAFTELHNEVDFSLVAQPADPGASAVPPEAMRAVEHVRRRHPEQLVTLSWGKPPHLAMHTVPAGLDVGQFHVYSYGVLDALQREIDIRATATAAFPNATLRGLQRVGAPSFSEYGRPAPWKLAATVVTDQMFYGYDTVDAGAWDAWLDAHYPRHEEVMRREIESRVIATAAWARWRGIPTVVGEGWIGYTPLRSWFEEGAAGLALAEVGIETALAEGVWGMVLCSNAAPHHPMWRDAGCADWQRRMNAEITRC